MRSETMERVLAMGMTFVVCGMTLAGTLDPPGPPAPTMVTLQQIYDKIGTGTGVAKTGQTACWDTTGAPISCTGTGQDGALQRGAATSPRFTDNANGTVKDNLTGLTWLKNASCLGSRSWTNALSDANSLANGGCGLADGSVAGDWRLPNLRELQSLIDYGRVSPALPVGHPFTGVLNVNYWTSTTQAAVPSYAWQVNIDNGFVPNYEKIYGFYVWPVRGGQ